MANNKKSPLCDIKQMFEKSKEKYGESTAFWVDNDEEKPYSAVTYKEAYDDVRGLGTSLVDRGMKGKKIAIIGASSYQWALSYLAVICGTGVAVLLDKKYCISELKQFLTATGCSGAIFSDELQDVFWQIRNDGVTQLEMLINMDKKKSEWDILSLQELIDEGKKMVSSGSLDFVTTPVANKELCLIFFTAGTTDVSKGVNLSHANIAAALTMVSAMLPVSNRDVFVSRLPLHCAQECLCSILLPLYKGASITYCEGVAPSFEISAVHGYSLTECASLAAINPENESAKYRLLPEMRAKIVDSDPETGIGEICLMGENVMMGYCNDPKASAEAIQDDWLHTGDLGWMDEKGCLYIAGRKENVIIAAQGKNVYPEELESRLTSLPYVLETMAWSDDSDESQAPMITATVRTDEMKIIETLGINYSKQELETLLWSEIHKINNTLPFFKRIKKIILRNEAFQKNSSQKILRYYPGNRRQ